jgi:hypothetical protein
MGFQSDNYELKTTGSSWGLWDKLLNNFAAFFQNVTGALEVAFPSFFDSLTFQSVNTPIACTVTPQTAGGTSAAYAVCARLFDGTQTVALITSTATSQANITAANSGNTVAWTAVPGAYSYDIYRTTAPTTPSTTGKIGNVLASAGVTSFLDNGYAGDGSTQPTVNTTGSYMAGFRSGAKTICGQMEEIITLSTSGLTTNSAQNLLPANSVILGVTARVVTTITTTTNWALGDGSTAARFAAANGTLTAGTTEVGLAHIGSAGMTQVAAAALRITCTGSNPGAGAIRVTVFFEQYVPATS